MMAVDLGGPINKAAYVFGIATLATSVAQGGSIVMAAVMAGGMVPPLAIFVATRLFKTSLKKSQVDAGLTNIVMGLSFVTEGAIPFAAADPIRVIPSFVVGSAFSWWFSWCCWYQVTRSSWWYLCCSFIKPPTTLSFVYYHWSDCFRCYLRFSKKPITK